MHQKKYKKLYPVKMSTSSWNAWPISPAVKLIATVEINASLAIDALNPDLTTDAKNHK